MQHLRIARLRYRRRVAGSALGLAAVLMLIPIVMVVLSLTLKYPVIRWVTIIAAVILFGLNLVGLPTYPSLYDQFLIVVGLVFNVLTVWYAWKWSRQET